MSDVSDIVGKLYEGKSGLTKYKVLGPDTLDGCVTVKNVATGAKGLARESYARARIKEYDRRYGRPRRRR